MNLGTTNVYWLHSGNNDSLCITLCILAHRRYLWKYLFDVVNKRNQENLIPEALRAIGCTYLAYQYESYFKCKGKHYDGSSSLKMIGNDCKLIELNMEKFLTTFIKANSKETWNSKYFEKLRQVNKLYGLFGDLARDIRSTTANKERAASFSTRAEIFFQKLKTWSGGDSVYGKPYLHVLRDHIGDYMVQWANLANWGYGVFYVQLVSTLIKPLKYKKWNTSTLINAGSKL